MKKKKIIIIAGPTASGKTDIAIALAQQFNTEIISADSRQCYKELHIGVAKPSPEQLSAVHHYFINSHSINGYISAADYESYALQAAEKIFQQNDVAVMVGGTGLYIKAFCEGLDDIPPINPAIKKTIAENYKDKGMSWLRETVSAEDPKYFEEGEIQNPHRLIRALEVKRSTGISILTHQTQNKKHRAFEITRLALEIPRAVLYERINKRVDTMISEGLQEEAYSLLPYKELNALQTVGYRELFDHFENHISLDRAIELIKQNTRNYAKRQVTWFKKEGFTWINPDNFSPTVLTDLKD